jgi:hypothetical protein
MAIDDATLENGCRNMIAGCVSCSRHSRSSGHPCGDVSGRPYGAFGVFCRVQLANIGVSNPSFAVMLRYSIPKRARRSHAARRLLAHSTFDDPAKLALAQQTNPEEYDEAATVPPPPPSRFQT